MFQQALERYERGENWRQAALRSPQPSRCDQRGLCFLLASVRALSLRLTDEATATIAAADVIRSADKPRRLRATKVS